MKSPFNCKFIEHKESRITTRRKCNTILFNSSAKFDSETGWSSFDDSKEGAVQKVSDADERRVEIVCTNCKDHLGHVFYDLLVFVSLEDLTSPLHSQ